MVVKNTVSIPNYEQYLERSDKIHFIGSRALFDPNFIPPVIVPQKNNSLLIKGILSDAIEDNYHTNITVYGMKGSGKNLMTNHLLQWLNLTQNGCISNLSDVNEMNKKAQITILHIDCDKKEPDQLFYYMIDELRIKLNLSIGMEKILMFPTGKLWNMLKFIISKSESSIIIYLQNAEYIAANIIDKFYVFAESTPNLHFIISLNTGVQQYSFKNFDHIQHKIRMDLLSPNELYQITADRNQMAFKTPLEKDAVDMLVNLISNFDVQTPGACINYLKELYPIAQKHGEILPEHLRNVTQYYFDTYHMDVMSFADYIIDTTIEDRLFLNYMVNFFQKPSRFYISFNEIKKAYLMSSEELGFKPKKYEFYQAFEKFTKIQLFRPNIRQISENTNKITGVYPVDHYLTLPLEEINEIIEYSFGITEKDDIE